MSYWDIRAEKYDNLDWTNREGYISKIMGMCNLKSQHIACDIGTGTGIMALELAKYCKEVVGIDISDSMLNIAKKNRNANNISYHLKNAENTLYVDNIFDCILARMSFHHIENQYEAIKECFRILKSGGTFVISEGVPPVGTRRFYTEMFKLKEIRRTYTVDDLVDLIESAGFKNIKIEIHHLPNMSINNWLNNTKESICI